MGWAWVGWACTITHNWEHQHTMFDHHILIEHHVSQQRTGSRTEVTTGEGGLSQAVVGLVVVMVGEVWDSLVVGKEEVGKLVGCYNHNHLQCSLDPRVSIWCLTGNTTRGLSSPEHQSSLGHSKRFRWPPGSKGSLCTWDCCRHQSCRMTYRPHQHRVLPDNSKSQDTGYRLCMSADSKYTVSPPQPHYPDRKFFSSRTQQTCDFFLA